MLRTAVFSEKRQRVPPDWAGYFEHNRRNLMTIPWDDPYRLTTQEAETILHSIQQFQLGESSEGNHFREQARRYATRSGDYAYLDALELFIQEEQRHARDLGHFMEQQGLPLAKSDWVDRVFRQLRHLMATLEISVVVLITAEIVAVTYYKALHDATAASALRQLCRQILHDEVQHLRFQADALAKIRQGHSSLRTILAHMLHRVLFGGTLLVVWWHHHPVFRAGKYSFRKFWKANWLRFNQTLAMT